MTFANGVCALQLTVVAYDNAYASTRATADVTLEVTRNENGPIFQPSATYQVIVSEELALGALVETVTAVDRDDLVSVARGCSFLQQVQDQIEVRSVQVRSSHVKSSPAGQAQDVGWHT